MSREFALQRPCSWLMVLRTPIRLKSCIPGCNPYPGSQGTPLGKQELPPRQGTRIGCGPEAPAPGDAFARPLAGRSGPRLAESTQANSGHTSFSLNRWPGLNISSLPLFPLHMSLGEGTPLFYSMETFGTEQRSFVSLHLSCHGLRGRGRPRPRLPCLGSHSELL